MLWRINHIILAVALLCACDSKPPLEDRGHEPDIVSISYIKSLYMGAAAKVRGEICIEGRIVANDRWGNFYRTIVVQDATGAIEVKLGSEELFVSFPYGETVRINCNGLAVGAYGGSIQLGMLSNDISYETDYIPEDRIPSVVKVMNGMGQESVPIPLTIANMHDPYFDAGRYVNCLVVLSGVQFIDCGGFVTWAEGETGATDRLLADIRGNTLVVRTSVMASFAGYVLPAGSGSIRGIFGWFNGVPQLKVYDPREVDMTNDRF